MKIYCQKCGHPSEYATYKPKFCSACGTPTDSTAKASEQQPLEEEEVESHIEVDRPPECIPFIQKLDVFIDASDTKPRPVKFEDALGSKDKGEEEYRRGLDPELDSETFKQQFQKEAGTLRKPNSNGPQKES